MNKSLQHAGEKKLSFSSLSWEEAIRLDAVTEEHVLHMQNIIINQEGIIDDLETRVQDTERLLDSLDVDMMLDILNSMGDISGLRLQEIKQELINFESRKNS